MEQAGNSAVYLITEEQISQMIDRALKKLIDQEDDPLLNKRICSKSEAANRLGVHRATIYNMIADGRLKTTSDGKHIQVGSLIRYERGECQKEETVKVNRRGRKVYV